MASGKIIGYVRVSSVDQNPERQLSGIECDRVFVDKASGKDAKRPQLQELLAYIRDEDTVVVHSMDRLARNLDDLRQIVFAITNKQATLKFLKESLTFSGKDSPLAKLMLSLMGAVAEFERSLILERQREGIALAVKRGAYKGRKPKLNKDQVKELAKRAQGGESKASIARDMEISRDRVYHYLRKFRETERANRT